MKKMTFFLNYLAVSVLCMSPLWVSAAGIDVNLNSQSVRFSVLTETGGAETEFGYLYNESEFKVGHAGIHIVDSTGSKSIGLDVALGGRIYGVVRDTFDTLAIGLGGAFIYAPTQLFGRLRFVLGGHYAPKVVTYADAIGLWEYSFDIEYQLLRQGFIYGGYRNLEVDLESEIVREIDEGGHFGIRIQF